jgi:hypothetical protein
MLNLRSPSAVRDVSSSSFHSSSSTTNTNNSNTNSTSTNTITTVYSATVNSVISKEEPLHTLQVPSSIPSSSGDTLLPSQRPSAYSLQGNNYVPSSMELSSTNMMPSTLSDDVIRSSQLPPLPQTASPRGSLSLKEAEVRA